MGVGFRVSDISRLGMHIPYSLRSRHGTFHWIPQFEVSEYLAASFEGYLGHKRIEEVYEKGYYTYRKPGMAHRPVFSKTGCLMFITCTRAENKEKV